MSNIARKRDQKKTLDMIVNEFSKKPYISKSHKLYPTSDNSEDEEEEKHRNDDSEDEDFNYNYRQLSEEELKRQHKIHSKLLKFSLLQNISPEEFDDIRKEFKLSEQNDQDVDLVNFVAILCKCLFQLEQFDPELEKEINAFVETFLMMDRNLRKSVTWNQVTDFLLEMQEIVSRDETLFDTKLLHVELKKQITHNPIDKIFHYPTQKYFGMLENNLKSIRLFHPITMHELEEIKIGSLSITNSIYLFDKSLIVIASNDKYINFYNVQSKALVRRFAVPEVQTFMEYSKQKNILYTSQHNKVLYAWDLQKVMEKEFEEQMYRLDAYKRILKEKVIIDSQKELTCIMNIDEHDLFVIGSNDCLIRLYKNNRSIQPDYHKLRGHTKGIISIAFNEELKYIISCGFDFDIFVWNTYLDYPVMKLPGNESPMNAVLCPPSQQYLMLSVDSKGILKLWDLTNFNCIQMIPIDCKNSRIRNMIYLEESNRLICCSKEFHIFEFDKSYNPRLADDKSIVKCCISNQNLELYTASANCIKCWDLKKGRIIRVFKNLCKGDITSMVLIPTFPADINQDDDRLSLIKSKDKELQFTERQVYIGSTKGEISLVDMLTGLTVCQIEAHSKEILFLQYSIKHSLLISGAQDKSIKIFLNYKKPEEKQQIVLLRTILNIYKNEITSGFFSDNLQMIGTSGRDSQIRFWDAEKGQFYSQIDSNIQASIFQMKLLDPLPLLVTSDIQGYIYVWGTPQSEYRNQFLLRWKNMFTISRWSQVTAIEYEYNEKLEQLHLVLGDETGYVRVLDISQVLQHFNIKPINPKQENRNMLRQNVYNYENYSNEYQNRETKKNPKAPNSQQDVHPLPEKSAKQIIQFQAHKHGSQDIAIVSLLIVNCTQTTNYLTIGADKKIRLFNNKGVLIGQLKQRDTALPNRNYLDSTNNNDDEQTQEWLIDVKQQNKTLLQVSQEEVKKSLTYVLEKRQQLRLNSYYPFIKDNEDDNYSGEMRGLSRVNSEAIYKELKEVDKYLNSNFKLK